MIDNAGNHKGWDERLSLEGTEELATWICMTIRMSPQRMTTIF